ncbi:MAG: outer rane lipoprotein carrier protein [Acidobacteriota bacterium]|nr:outer rane lipoprotein carrier protein [Acidobacteriota bacterium]MDT7808929.1 outer rane lipoprotein carrier protein [Acidobacteriota bacterium]
MFEGVSMKKYFAPALAILMLVASLSVAPPRAQAQGPGLVSSILNKMDRNRRSLASLRAAITMQKYNAQLRDFDMSSGDVQYVAGKGRDANVRVDWTKPAHEILAVTGGQYKLYRPRLNQAYQGSTQSAGQKGKAGSVLGFALNMSGSQAKNQFDIEPTGEGTLYDGGPHVWMLKLTPKGSAGYKFAEVWVDDNGMPVQTRVTEKNGDSTLVRLTNIERNPSIPSSTFDLTLPAGTKIVKG